MHCLNRNQHVAFFFRNLLIQEKNCRNLPWLSNLNWSKSYFPSVVGRTCSPTHIMSEEVNKTLNPEVLKDEDEQITEDGFYFLDSLPSPVLIDIDHPHKYRKNSLKKSNYKSAIKKLISNQPRSDDSVASCSGPRTDSRSSIGKSQPIAKATAKIVTNEASALEQESRKEEVTSKDDDDIVYEGTFAPDFLSFKIQRGTSFFRENLLKSTTASRFQKRRLSSSKTPDDIDTLSKKSKLHHHSKRRNLCSLVDQNENRPQTKSGEIGYGETLGSIDNYISRVPSSSDSDSDVVIEDEIRIEKVRTSSHFKSKATSSSTTAEDPLLFSSLTKKDLEEGEISSSDSLENRLTDYNTPDDDLELDVISLTEPSHEDEENEIYEPLDSDDSVPHNAFSEPRSDTDYDSTEMDILDDSSDSDVSVAVDNSDFIPLRNIKLTDIDYDVPITDDVRTKRQNLEAIRKWELTGLGAEMIGSSKNIDGTLFTLLSYNVLAQQLIQDNIRLYENCKPEILEWSYRWALLQHEIRHLQPDIMTFQEVESAHYHTHYLPWFSHWGYKCIFKKRTGTKCDGCIIVYNGRKFTLIEENSVEFNQPKGGSILDRDNIGIIAKLTPTAFHSPFCVATTHILFNPRRADVKLAQFTLLLTELDRICYEKEEGGQPVYCPIILTGDFNAEPHSRVLDVVRKGTLRYSGLSKRTLSRYGRGPNFEMELVPPILGISDHCQHNVLQQGRYFEKIRGNLFSLADKRKIEETLIKIYHSDRKSELPVPVASSSSAPGSSFCSSSGVISHSFNFKSAYYHKLRRANDSPEVTTFQDRWVTVDYIFYTRKQSYGKAIEGDLKLIGRYGLLSPAEAMRVGPLPSDICPSDHLPLAAQFLLRRKKS